MPLNGSETSSTPGTSPEATLTSGASLARPPATPPDTTSAISAPASAEGLSPSSLPAGPMTDLFGQEVAPASPSPQRGSVKASTMSGTFGRIGLGSLMGDDLQSSLENRLRARLTGSDLCEVIWTHWATPWGPRRSRPRARVRTISATDIGLWATIRASDGEKGGPNMKFGAGGMPLPAQAAQSTWPTPQAFDAKDNGFPRALRFKGNAPSEQHNVRDPNRAASYRGTLKDWVGALFPATWQAPTHNDSKPAGNVEVTEFALGAAARDTVRRLRVQAAASVGSSDQTEKRGALNPEFVCWLMGYPPEWLNCAPSEMPSTRARPLNSSPLSWSVSHDG